MRVSTGQRPVGTPLLGTMHKMQKARCVVAQFDLETDKADVDSPLSAVIMFKAKKMMLFITSTFLILGVYAARV